MHVASVVEELSAHLVDLTSPGQLFDYRIFVDVYENPEPYVDDVLRVMSDPAIDEQRKVIAGLMMQRLPLERFVAFSESLLSMLERGQIGEMVFGDVVFPSYEFGARLAERHDDPRTISLSRRILASEHVDEARKRYVEHHLLTGRALADLEFWREIHGTPPRSV